MIIENTSSLWLARSFALSRYYHRAVIITLERLRFMFTPNGKRELVPHDQVFPLIVVYCLLLLLKNK